MVEEAIAANRAVIEGEVLKAALALSPTPFEELVIRLLGAMGYGRSDNRMGQLERTSASGDAGIDGIISQDPLGHDRIYVQAKHCAVDRPIGRPTDPRVRRRPARQGGRPRRVHHDVTLHGRGAHGGRPLQCAH